MATSSSKPVLPLELTIPEGKSMYLSHNSYRSAEKTVIGVVLSHMTFSELVAVCRGVE